MSRMEWSVADRLLIGLDQRAVENCSLSNRAHYGPKSLLTGKKPHHIKPFILKIQNPVKKNTLRRKYSSLPVCSMYDVFYV